MTGQKTGGAQVARGVGCEEKTLSHESSAALGQATKRGRILKIPP